MAKPTPKGNSDSNSAQEILEAVAIGVVAVDTDGRITYFNQAAARLSGVDPEKALGRHCREVLKSSLCDDDCPLALAFDSGEIQYNRDAVFIRQDGRSVLPVKVSITPLLDHDENPLGAVETIQGYGLAQLFNHGKGYDWEDFIGESPQVQRIFEVLKVVGPTPVTMLIEGPTGTGKDLLANIIHQNSPRAHRPFIKVNCAALPENLLESELFGYARGAFTGADKDKPGRFQLAQGGTIFLDEISELPLSLQAKLLRVIEDREFFPLGGRRTVKVDVRVITACNKALSEQVKCGQFREDLYYRLNVVRIYIPPLRERRQDLPLLIRRLIQKKNVERGTYICKLSERTLEILLNHHYPGNVRELQNIIEHACLLCQGDVISENHLPWELLEQHSPLESQKQPEPTEREALINALVEADWNRSKAAQALNIDRTTLWRRMKRLGVTAP